ncbi:DUF6544 family protein [Anaeromyxobacter paludicola]|uniref:DUF6544 family protein n=1 Tax=Anaeromyxobacter paludicola TaxID=2918171 RepID=UPI0020BF2506|nr:DUF6544 family protein [Anaeromyxobacter paludicola]
MLWILLWALVCVVGGLGLLVSVQGLRFERRVAREARALWAAPGAAGAPALTPLEALPPPVRRYLEVSGAASRAPLRGVRLRHGGTFRPGGEAWLPISGVQYFSADAPGFVWWGRVRVAPGISVGARDRSVGGEGNMHVLVSSTFTLQDARGPTLDQGALLRLLGELVWLPTALRDARYVRWEPLDAASARATLGVGGRTVTATFHFGPDGLPARFTAERYRDVKGEGVLTPFVGACADYREVDGLKVPFRMEAAWIVDGRERPYARFQVEQLELDPAGPF